jgi:D-alanyl-D-alanine carboxypeptidase (penicillin-binding protein 5/6)
VKRRPISGLAPLRRTFGATLACLISGLALTPVAAAPALAGVPGGSPGAVGGSRLGGHGVIVSYPDRGARLLPLVRASAYVVADAGTGQVLAAMDPHGWFAPASTLKVLTAITLMPVLKPDAIVVTSHQAAIVEPSKIGLIAGRGYTVADLFRALLLVSANDAAISLAEETGSLAQGIAMMNAEAQRLHADDTVVMQPNGLDAPGQHVSAYDEALFARQALKMPMFMRDDELVTARFPVGPHHPVTMDNHDTMLTDYPGDLGGKGGWTTPAGATYLGFARRHGVTLIVTLLHCPALTEMTSAARLLDWGFAMDGKVTPVGTLVDPQAPRTTARVRRNPRAQVAARPLPAGRGVPLAAGAGAVVLAAVIGGSAAVVSRRRPRGGSRPAP